MSRYRRSNVAGGTYFFTLALADRTSSALIQQIETLRAAYVRVQRDSPFQTIAICILPEHLHAVWRLPADDADFSSRWSAIKAGFSRAMPPAERSASKIAKRERGVWQRRFWEHQIRDELDLQRHVDYIRFNPVKHGLVQRVADWPYSSFHRYVKAGESESDWAGHSDAVAGCGEPA